jgi:NAD-dependent SIR2 family protein deacetylase
VNFPHLDGIRGVYKEFTCTSCGKEHKTEEKISSRQAGKQIVCCPSGFIQPTEKVVGLEQ